MTRTHLKPWLAQRATAIAIILFLLSLCLYTAAFLVERGFQSLSPATILAAVATALLLSSVSVTIEKYVTSRLTDPDIVSILAIRQLGIAEIQERDVSSGLFTGMPPTLLTDCHHELLIVAYSADSFVNHQRKWLAQALDEGRVVGLLLLHPETLEQATQTELRDAGPHLQTTLGICKQLLAEKPDRKSNFKVKGHRGHFYFTGVLLDRFILEGESIHKGTVRIQLKANYKTQHEGLVITLTPDSKYAQFYSDSCKALWNAAEDLLANEPRSEDADEKTLRQSAGSPQRGK